MGQRQQVSETFTAATQFTDWFIAQGGDGGEKDACLVIQGTGFTGTVSVQVSDDDGTTVHGTLSTSYTTDTVVSLLLATGMAYRLYATAVGAGTAYVSLTG